MYDSDTIAEVINIITIDINETGSQIQAGVLPRGSDIGSIHLSSGKAAVSASISENDVQPNKQQSLTEEVAASALSPIKRYKLKRDAG